MYEGIVFRSDEPAARAAFENVAVSLRLVRLADGVFGIHGYSGRGNAFDQTALEGVAEQLSSYVGRAIALFYDNSCGIRVGVLYTGGRRGHVFGDGNAWWVPYGKDGPRFRANELRPDMEYECIFSAIDAGLEAIDARPPLDAALVKQAFCYDELGLADRQ